MKRRETRKRKLEKKRKIRKFNSHLLKKIDTLPIELVHEIRNYLPLKIQDMITPLECTDIFDLMSSYYWLNFRLYFYEHFNKRDLKHVMDIKNYFHVIKTTKYVKYKNQIYEKQDARLNIKMRELAEIEVYSFFYHQEQQERNIRERISLTKSKDYIEQILQTASYN